MVLKGTTAVRKTLSWTIEAKVRLYGLVKNDGKSVKEALDIVASESNFVLPPSYAEFPHSHFCRIRKELQTAVEKNKAEVISALRAANLIED